MEQKKIMIAIAAILLIVAGAVYLGKGDSGAAEVPAASDEDENIAESSISSPYAEEKDADANADKESADFAILEKLVDAFPDTDFTQQTDDSFQWMDGSDDSPLKLEGKSIEAAGISGHPDFKSAFERAGFEEDMENAADGNKNGQAGFSDGKTVCLYEYTLQGEGDSEGEGKTPVYDIKISCAKAP